VLAVSINKPETNKGFRAKLGATFPFLSDQKRAVSRQYGALSIFRLAKRVTFVMDKQGTIRHVDRGSAAADPSSAIEAAAAL
jgi:peroxiredoxin